MRETLEKRMSSVGVKNIARMELFLWDLEMFLHLQRILGDRLVLKGGAAVQFYLPIENQRTSVDIDLLFHGSFEEINTALGLVETAFPHENGLFRFQHYKPKRAKTKLPLHTYHVLVPSVCTLRELRNETGGQQRLKIEFIISQTRVPFVRIKGEHLFAVESREDYQVLPLNELFADKLTTLGPNTIGIQNDRMDEQVKQIYDLVSLLNHHEQALSLLNVRQYYMDRAHEEAFVRGVPFVPSTIEMDILNQLDRFRSLDDGKELNADLWRYVLNFISLYAGHNAIRSKGEWAIAGEKLRFLMLMIWQSDDNGSKFVRAQNIERILQFNHISGVERGHVIQGFRKDFIAAFGNESAMPSEILKGKAPSRIFWSFLSPANLDAIEEFVWKRLGSPAD